MKNTTEGRRNFGYRNIVKDVGGVTGSIQEDDFVAKKFKDDIASSKAHSDTPETESSQTVVVLNDEDPETETEDLINAREYLYENYYLAKNPAGTYVAFVKKPYNDLTMNNKLVIRNWYLMDKIENITLLLGNDGEILGDYDNNQYDMNYHPYPLPIQEIFGNIIEYPTTKIVKKKKVTKTFPGKKIVNFNTLSLIKKNVSDFLSSVNSGVLVDAETPIESLIRIAFTEPGQFDEVFAIEVDRPESPLMRKYLSILAELVNEGLGTLEDDGIEDIKPLQEKAYKKTGYIGKTLEVVIQEAKDYAGHFRFLLLKGERIVIDEKWKDYFNLLVKQIDSDGLKKKPTNSEVFELCSQNFALKESTNIRMIKDKILITYYAYVDNIYEVTEHFNLELSAKIGLVAKAAKVEYFNETGKDTEVGVVIIICDKNVNIGQFDIRKQTLIKWSKLGQDLVEQAEQIFKEKGKSRFYRKIEFVI